MGVDRDAIVSNIKQILLHLKQAGVRPIMQSTLLPSARLHEWNAAASVRKLNTILKEWCATDGIDFLDLNEVLAPGGALDEAFTTDGIHLRLTAYQDGALLLILFCGALWKISATPELLALADMVCVVLPLNCLGCGCVLSAAFRLRLR